MKFIVSFTTSPDRIHKIKPMIDSILTQTIKPALFLLNIPKVFPRTGKTYTIPSFVKEAVSINVVERDYGPGTKLIPTIEYLKNNNYDINDTYIIYLDDDIAYRPDMVAAFRFLLLLNNTERVICGGGFKFVIKDNKLKYHAVREHNVSVEIAEGYAAVCVPLSLFKQDFMSYALKYTTQEKYKHCMLSDDVIFSNYYLKSKVSINTVCIPNKFSVIELWKHNGILDYGNEADALHCGASGISTDNMTRYGEVLKTLAENNELFIKIYKLEEEQEKTNESNIIKIN